MAENFRPHVIVVDVSLPGVNPRSLCRLIRSDADLSDAQLIAVSGRMTEGIGQGLIQDGFDGFLKKPFGVREFLEVVDGVLAAVT